MVFIVGLDDGILPHSRSFDEPEEMEEERRLFYVGITRAKDRLYLVRAMRRGGRGYAEETIQSRFLDDIPGGAGQRASPAPGNGTQATAGAAVRLDSALAAPARATIIEQKFRAGIRVNHPIWGEGIVLDSRVQDGDEIVDVVFDSVGIKRLAASLANLTILK